MLRPRIFGCLWILCLLSPEIQGLCTKPDLSDNVLSNSSNADFTEGSSLRLSCVLGYQPASGRRTVTCQDGGWVPEPKDFTCKKKLCGNPAEVKNGRYKIPEGIEFGAVITPVCNQGYYLAGQGDGSRTCSADGTWTGQEPFCEVVKCSSPPSIENGHVESAPKEEYQFDDLVIYACNADYTLFGNRESRCSVSEASGKGTWTEQPRCKKVECQKPDVPNATPTGSGGSGPYKYKAVLTYKCNEGFHLVSGEARIVCEENGWSSNPKCEEKPVPPVPWLEIIIGILVGAGIVVVVVIVGYRYKRSKSGKISTNNDGCEPTPNPDNDTVLTPLKTDISPPPNEAPVAV